MRCWGPGAKLGYFYRTVAYLSLVACMLAASSVSVHAQHPSSIFERIVAVVDKEVITQGELEAEARLALVLRNGNAAADVPLSQDYLRAFANHLISQMLVAQEARRMGAEGAADVDIEARLNALQAQFSGREAYLSFISGLTMDLAGVRAVMARDVQNDRYIAQRLRTRLLAHNQTRVTAHKSPELKETKALEGWLSELRRAAQVRVLSDEGVLHLEHRR